MRHWYMVVVECSQGGPIVRREAAEDADEAARLVLANITCQGEHSIRSVEQIESENAPAPGFSAYKFNGQHVGWGVAYWEDEERRPGVRFPGDVTRELVARALNGEFLPDISGRE